MRVARRRNIASPSLSSSLLIIVIVIIIIIIIPPFPSLESIIARHDPAAVAYRGRRRRVHPPRRFRRRQVEPDANQFCDVVPLGAIECFMSSYHRRGGDGRCSITSDGVVALVVRGGSVVLYCPTICLSEGNNKINE
jgi:hypothetical protein